jgi:hypothetical protein
MKPDLSLLPLSRSVVTALRPADLAGFAEQPLPAAAVRAITYMADIEGHTIAYLRELLATRVVDDPVVAGFLASWFYEESAHGRALAAALAASGHPLRASTRQTRGWRARLEAWSIAAVSAAWPEFVAVHMTWGAINELTTLFAYRRLADVADHAPLAALLGHIVRDESRHFGFYYGQAARRLAASAATRRVVRGLIERFWAPVGFAVRGDDLSCLTTYLFSDGEGQRAVRQIDRTIRRLPGLADISLVEAWLARHPLAA